MHYRILVVDDDPDIRALLRRWLERNGHAVDEAEDGTRGLGMTLDGNYDIAFIDIGLPGPDGYEIARRVHAAPARRPCLVALTASTDDPEVAFQAGFDGHVFKPVTERTIAAVLQEMPRRKRG
jgi:CheY-like chemotaxis protein